MVSFFLHAAIALLVAIGAGAGMNRILHRVGLGAGRRWVELLTMIVGPVALFSAVSAQPALGAPPWGGGVVSGVLFGVTFVPFVRLASLRGAKGLMRHPERLTRSPEAEIPAWAEPAIADARARGWEVARVSSVKRLGPMVDMIDSEGESELSIVRVAESPLKFWAKAPGVNVVSVTEGRRGVVSTGTVGAFTVDQLRWLAQWDAAATTCELLDGHRGRLEDLRSRGIRFHRAHSPTDWDRATSAALRSSCLDAGWEKRAATGIDRLLTTRRHDPSPDDVAAFVEAVQDLSLLPPPPTVEPTPATAPVPRPLSIGEGTVESA